MCSEPEPGPRLRAKTFDPIVVKGTGGGDDQVYKIVEGQIPDDLQEMLERPFTEHERQQIFHRVDLIGAQHMNELDRPKALWIFGPPAVGKTTTSDERSSLLFGRPGNAVTIDGDDIRMAHEGFQRVAQHGLLNGVVHADAWQRLKETKFVEGLKKEIVKLSIKNRQHLRIPEAVLNPKRVKAMLKDLEAANYEMHAICIWAPESETQVRGRSRSVKAGKVFTSQFYKAACEGSLDMACFWERQLAEGNPHYKCVVYYDNTVKPSRPLHSSQFKLLSNLSFEDADKHAEMCKAASEAHMKADICASEARARGAAPSSVARLWIQQQQLQRGETKHSEAGPGCASLAANADDFGSLLCAEKWRGRVEGLVLGMSLSVFVPLTLRFLLSALTLSSSPSEL